MVYIIKPRYMEVWTKVKDEIPYYYTCTQHGGWKRRRGGGEEETVLRIIYN